MDLKARYPSEQRVYLAPFDGQLISRCIQLSHDPELVLYMGWRPFGADEKDRFMESVEVISVPYLSSGRAVMFSILTIAQDKPIGYVCLKGMNEKHLMAELGIAIVEKEYRSQGYGTEALRLAVNYGFDELGLNLIALTSYTFNERAIKAYEKVGFIRRQVLEKAWPLVETGEYVDLLLIELTRDQWVERTKTA